MIQIKKKLYQNPLKTIQYFMNLIQELLKKINNKEHNRNINRIHQELNFYTFKKIISRN